MKVSVKGKKDLMDRIRSKVHSTRNRKDDFGNFEISRSSDNILAAVKYVLTTGNEAFDKVTGGVPFGRITEIYGLDGCGKTAVAIRCAIRAQLRHIYEKIKDDDGPTILRRIPEDSDVTILYIDNEHSLEEDDKTVMYDENDPSKEPVRIDCLTADCDTVDQLFKMVDTTLDLIKEEEKSSGRTQFVVVVVDTIASTSSKEEMTAEWGKVDYARQPKQLREGFRKMTRRLSRQNVAMICLNQVSDKIGAEAAGGKKVKYSTPQDDDFATFGGRALKYYATLRIFMFKMKGKYCLIPKTQFSHGFLIGFRTTKNRQTKPMREGRLSLLFDKGYNNCLSKMETMLFLGFCEMGDKGDIRIRYRQKGITPVTYGATDAKAGGKSLQDEDEGRDIDPRVENKAAWLTHYRDHKEDLDKLWEAAVDYMFNTEIVADAAPDDDDDESIALEEEVDD